MGNTNTSLLDSDCYNKSAIFIERTKYLSVDLDSFWSAFVLSSLLPSISPSLGYFLYS